MDTVTPSALTDTVANALAGASGFALPQYHPEPPPESPRKLRRNFVAYLGVGVTKRPFVPWDSEEGGAAQSLAKRVMAAYSQLRDPNCDRIEIAIALSEKLCNPRTRKLKVKVPHCWDDLDDPGTVLIDWIEQLSLATHQLVCGDSVVSFVHLAQTLDQIKAYLSDEYNIVRRDVRTEPLMALEYFLGALVHPRPSPPL